MHATFHEMLQLGQRPKKVALDIAGKRTSIRLEPAFLDALDSIAKERGVSRQALVNQLHEYRPYLENGNLASVMRLFVLSELQRKAGGTP